MKLLVFFVVLIILCVQSILATTDPQTRCSNRMASEMPITFPESVSHGIHSLTMSDIHFYFPSDNIPTDKEDFHLPVINPDLESPTLVLSRPMDFKHSFMSPALRAVDQILSHMNSPRRGMANYNDLEKIVHAAHMQDIWSRAGKEFLKLQESNEIDSELCGCIRDVERNGILRSLKRSALKNRDPDSFYGTSDYGERKLENAESRLPNAFHHHPKLSLETDPESMERKVANAEPRLPNAYHHHPKLPNALHHHAKLSLKVESKDKERNLANVMEHQPSYEMISPEILSGKRKDPEEIPLPSLKTVNDWNIWKEEDLSMKPYEDEDSKQIAMFMYCVLQ